MAPEERCVNVWKCVMSLEAQAAPFCNSQHSPAQPCQAHPIPARPITALPSPALRSLAQPITYTTLAIAPAHSHTPWPYHKP